MSDTKNLEDEFHRDMLGVYEKCAEHGYRPTQFRSLVETLGGTAAARHLLASPETSGLAKLMLMGLSEFSMEALVTKDRYQALFSQKERDIAQARLAAPGPVGPV